ncbi:MAG: acyltransferase family protein [Minwuia sp.]|nr:acyltransferase family protein [Minwuia sp.]
MRYRPEIDGLRALAVVPVILFHAGFGVFSGGYVGVDVFFVISGYLITAIIVAESNKGQFSLLRFYQRRIRRILPALLFVVICCIPVAWLVLLPGDMRNFAQSVFTVATFSSNILFWNESGYFDTAAELKPLLHTWSLAVEEQFYVFFPLLFLAFWKRWKSLFPLIFGLLFVFSLLLAQWGAHNQPIAAFYLLPARGWELLIGAFAALYLQNRQIGTPAAVNNALSFVGLSLILFSIFAFDAHTPFPGFYALVPTCGTVLIILFALEGTLVHRLLTVRVIVGIGLISYSAYLWHQPVLAFYRNYYWNGHDTFLILLAIFLTFLLAYLTWKFVELPTRNPARFSVKSIYLLCGTGTLLIASFGAAWHLTGGIDNRSIVEKFAVFDFDIKDQGHATCTDPSLEAADISLCYLSNPGHVNAVLIGDSHAEDKFFGLAGNLADRDWALIGNSSCPPVLGIVVEGDQKGCREKIEAIFQWVTNQQDINLVVLSYFGNYFLTTNYAADHVRYNTGPANISVTSDEVDGGSRADIFRHGLYRAIDTLISSGKQIVVAVDIPELPYLPLECEKGRQGCGTDRATVMARQDAHRKMLVSLQMQFPEISVFDPLEMFCTGDTCGYRTDDVILYRDSHHLTRLGSDQYGALFAAWLSQIRSANDLD